VRQVVHATGLRDFGKTLCAPRLHSALREHGVASLNSRALSVLSDRSVSVSAEVSSKPTTTCAETIGEDGKQRLHWLLGITRRCLLGYC
jgi:hypothetical protein